MKKSISTIGTIAIMEIMLVSAYLLGTTQAETITEIQTITEIREVIPDGYVDTSSHDFYNNFVDMRTVVDFSATEYGLQLYCEDGSGYYIER